MNQNVDHMIAYRIIAVKVVIQRKTDVGNRPIGEWALKTGPGKIFQTEIGNANMVVVSNISDIIKNKWSRQSLGIDQDDDAGQHG